MATTTHNIFVLLREAIICKIKDFKKKIERGGGSDWYLYVFFQTPCNTLQTPLNSLQTPFKIISFFAKNMGGKK